MEWTNRHSKRFHKKIKYINYSCNLQFYANPPTHNISLKEFDDMAIERLKILRSVERWNLSSHVKSSEEWMNKLYDEFKQSKNFIIMADKSNESKIEQIQEARQRDVVSHYILRLVYCKTDELRRWFVNLEADLFRARFMNSMSCGIINVPSFFAENNLHYTTISEEEKNKLRKNLLEGTYNVLNSDQLQKRLFYKVPFTKVLDLVKARKVFIKKGFAYVPNTDLISIIVAVFRARLSYELTLTERALPQIDDDERLKKLLHNFENRFTGDNSQKKITPGQQITPQMIHKLSQSSFPLCMRNMQEHLNVNNHLKYGGRLQYGLFLKVAGLSLEDAMKFFRSHFTKMMDVDKFDKEYAYGIRYNYGKEGKMKDFKPHSCMKIIMSNVSTGDIHGCPFRHFDEAVLRQRLVSYRVPIQGINEIMDLVKNKHYQIACQKYFEVTHNSTIDSGINHPNQYFTESMDLLHGKKEASIKSRKIQTNKTVVPSSQQSNLSDSMSDSLFEDPSFLDDLNSTLDMST